MERIASTFYVFSVRLIWIHSPLPLVVQSRHRTRRRRRNRKTQSRAFLKRAGQRRGRRSRPSRVTSVPFANRPRAYFFSVPSSFGTRASSRSEHADFGDFGASARRSETGPVEPLPLTPAPWIPAPAPSPPRSKPPCPPKFRRILVASSSSRDPPPESWRVDSRRARFRRRGFSARRGR